MAEEYIFNEELRSVLGEKAKKFKRKVMGIRGKEKEKSLEELSKILCNLKVIDSLGEGKEVIENSDGKYFIYESKLSLMDCDQNYKYLLFQRQGKGEKYKITKGLLVRDEEEDF